MKKCLAVMASLALALVLVTGCAEVPSSVTAPASTSAEERTNFRLLVSDEANDIGDFASVNVTISRIGIQQSGEAGEWVNYDLDPKKTVDLTELTGDNATEIFSGYVEPGEYTKVFIYAENVTGVLVGDETATVKLPSGKLQISKPFTLGDDLLVNFVFDVTVIKAGQSGKYILKPQIGESGAEQEFNEVGERETERHEEQHGKPEDELRLRLKGELGLGKEVTLIVTDKGSPVEGATVTVNGEEKGLTDTDGRLTIVLPDTPGEVKIEATLDGKTGDFELELEELEEQSEWFEGTITAISQGEENASPWTMSLKGVTGPVTVYVVELEGTPSIGAKAEVQGILVGNIINEAKAEVKGKGKP